jgi:RimJ/RimL family protein N-acetyltransferase
VLTDVWPLFGLVLRTPRLELRIPSLEQLATLAGVADEGIHDPAVMPFMTPWSQLPPGERGRSTVQYQWRTWAELTPQRWAVEFVVLRDGEVLGLQGINATDFGTGREVASGSWLGRRYHGRGVGTEMRAAVLHLAFAGLGAEWATSVSASDNPASIGVSRKLGYADDGIAVAVVGGAARVDRRFRMDREAWEKHRTVPVEIAGLEPCLPLLGLAPVSPPASGAPAS